jgi:hypothetical protein
MENQEKELSHSSKNPSVSIQGEGSETVNLTKGEVDFGLLLGGVGGKQKIRTLKVEVSVGIYENAYAIKITDKENHYSKKLNFNALLKKFNLCHYTPGKLTFLDKVSFVLVRRIDRLRDYSLVEKDIQDDLIKSLETIILFRLFLQTGRVSRFK